MKVVVKIGSRVLAEDPPGRVARLAAGVARARADGHAVVVVTSGAIALGVARMGLGERPRELPRLQAAAAVGQGALMEMYERAFAAHGLHVGQVLLTHEDVADRTRFLNARHTFAALLDMGAVPVVNENDTVAVDEIKFGDNDRLAALVASIVEADLLVLLTDVEGLMGEDGQLVSEVRDIGAAAAVAGGAGDLGTGGMASKVEAARVAGRAGAATVVASGRAADALARAIRGEPVGTRFPAPGEALVARKHWIAYVRKPEGALVVDDGAHRALTERGSSLLPSGVVEVRGAFAIGACVSVLDRDGREFARGLAGYASDEIERIRGRHTREIEAALGYKYLDEVIHRDELVLL